MLCDVRADCEERGIEAALADRALEIVDACVALELHAQRQDPRDLAIEDVAREPVGRDSVAHHPAGLLCLLADRHVMSA